MPVAGGGFDQCYNAQAAVAAGSLLVVASAVSQAPNDKQQLEPMLDKIEALADELGKLAGGYGLFQRGERRGLRQGGDRTADRHGPSAASSSASKRRRRAAPVRPVSTCRRECPPRRPLRLWPSDRRPRLSTAPRPCRRVHKTAHCAGWRWRESSCRPAPPSPSSERPSPAPAAALERTELRSP